MNCPCLSVCRSSRPCRAIFELQQAEEPRVGKMAGSSLSATTGALLIVLISALWSWWQSLQQLEALTVQHRAALASLEQLTSEASHAQQHLQESHELTSLAAARLGRLHELGCGGAPLPSAAERAVDPLQPAPVSQPPERSVTPIASAAWSSSGSLGLSPGDHLLHHRAGQPYHSEGSGSSSSPSIPRDFVIVRTRTQPDFLMFVGDPDQDHMVSSMVWDGYYEPQVSAVVHALLTGVCGDSVGVRNHTKPGPLLVVDVGANLGWFSLFAAAHGPHVHVVAVEPQPRATRLLRHSIAANGLQAQITLHEAGVATAEFGAVMLSQGQAGHNWGGVVSHPVRRKPATSSSASGGLQQQEPGGGGASRLRGTIEVPAVTLDEITAEIEIGSGGGRELCLLKVDA